jgi:AraC-like DNA-binding protein
MGPLIRAASLRGFGELVRELGGDPVAVCTRFGIEPAALDSDDELVSITAHDRMLDATARDLGCPDLGLRLATTQDITILGPMAVAIEASSTVGEALACASRFMVVHSPALSVGVEPDPRGARGVVALTYRKDLRESTYSPQGIELGLALFHRVATSLIGKRYGVRSVEIPHAPMSPVSHYVKAFGVDVKFGAGVAALRVQRSALDARFHGSNEAIHARAVAHLADRHDDPTHRVSVQVRLALAELLGTSRPSLAGVARLLQTHPRTLQRRLAEEATSFETVLDSVRHEAALRYLATTELPMSQVSSLVGFGEQSTLARAVRRWEGRSPREVRLSATLSR